MQLGAAENAVQPVSITRAGSVVCQSCPKHFATSRTPAHNAMPSSHWRACLRRTVAERMETSRMLSSMIRAAPKGHFRG
eukprot:5114176-Alexandrium_andersonii.AAC.1